MKDQYYDQLLNIKTSGHQKGFNTSLHFHRYEPTPYEALEVLLRSYSLKNTDRFVDFGCGKGRSMFYIHYVTNANVVGIEMNEAFYQDARSNRETYLKKHKSRKDCIQLYHCYAEQYPIDPRDNRFYFFNPFSIQIFMNVVINILRSVEEAPRVVDLILYYPSEDYIYYLEHQTHFQLVEEIILPEINEYNVDERFLIYRLAY